MFSGIPGLARKRSIDSFVTPLPHTDQPFEGHDSSGGPVLSGGHWLARKSSTELSFTPTDQSFDGTDSSGGTLRRLRSFNRLQQPRMALPQISPLLVTRAAIVHVRHKTLAWKTWTRQALKLTKHTISLHRCSDSEVLDIIVLCKVRRVGRVSKQLCCLQVETVEDKTYYFAFGSEIELYNWLTDIHLATDLCGNPTDFAHPVHVEPDKTNKHRLIGLPEEWQKEWQVDDFYPARDSILPEISFPHPDPIIDFIQELPGSRPTTPDSQLESEDEAIIMEAQIATQPVTQRLIDMQPSSSLKIITGDYSFRPPGPSALLSASEESPSTPLLTPDVTPQTPFRESPYRYRDSDARDLSGQVHKQGEWAEAHGGFADIWRALWEPEVGVSFPVAVKVLRVLSQDESIKAKIHRRLRKEVRVWHQLRHKNIVQMYGTCDGFGPIPSMVSQWYGNGSINAYLRKLGTAGTVEKRLKLLTEVARGLNYLHTFIFPVADDSMAGANIVHGDLKGANILVNDQGEAALADFGLSSVLAAPESTTSSFACGSVRWMAPELFLSDFPHGITSKTCASDTYSYGSVILEVITGERPYKDISNDLHVFNQVVQGYKPKRPLKPTLNSGVWELMQCCWETMPSDRPTMSLVLYRMEKLHIQWRRSMKSHSL